MNSDAALKEYLRFIQNIEDETTLDKHGSSEESSTAVGTNGELPHEIYEISYKIFKETVGISKTKPNFIEMIKDLLSMNMEIPRIKKFIELETNVSFNTEFFKAIQLEMSQTLEERQITIEHQGVLMKKMSAKLIKQLNIDKLNNTVSKKVTIIIQAPTEQENNNVAQITNTRPIVEPSNTESIPPIDNSRYKEPYMHNPRNYKDDCRYHLHLPEFKADDLVREGDMFNSFEEFENYATYRAKKWCYYYKRGHVHPNKHPKCYSRCNFLCALRKHTPMQPERNVIIRKRQKSMLTQCPARVIMRRKPGETKYTVIHACHHHDHKLTPEFFQKMQHFRHLPQHIKDEILDLARLGLEHHQIRHYIENKTQLNLRLPNFSNYINIHKERKRIIIPEKRMKELLEIIHSVRLNYPDLTRQIKSGKTIARTNKKYEGKQTSPNTKNKSKTKRTKRAIDKENSIENPKKSRLEARLDEIVQDEEVKQAVIEMRRDYQIETQDNIGHRDFDTENDSLTNDDKIYTIIDVLHDHCYDVSKEAHTSELTTGMDDVIIEIPDAIDEDENIITQRIIGPRLTSTCIGPDFNNETQIDVLNDENKETAETITKTSSIEYATTIDKLIKEVRTDNDEDIGITDIMNEIYESDDLETADLYEDNVNSVSDETEMIDQGVQVDFEMIGIERDYEQVKELEERMLTLSESDEISATCRKPIPGRDTEETIINKYNIDMYINSHNISVCLENLCKKMSISILELLKKVYSGRAVFKMIYSKASTRYTKLVYVPLSSLPYEKFKFINHIDNYKQKCSQYVNFIHNLETLVKQMKTEMLEVKSAHEKTLALNRKLVIKVANLSPW